MTIPLLPSLQSEPLDTREFSKNVLLREDLSIYPTVTATTAVSEKEQPPTVTGLPRGARRGTREPVSPAEGPAERQLLLSQGVWFCSDSEQLRHESDFIFAEMPNASTVDAGGAAGGQGHFSV